MAVRRVLDFEPDTPLRDVILPVLPPNTIPQPDPAAFDVIDVDDIITIEEVDCLVKTLRHEIMRRLLKPEVGVGKSCHRMLVKSFISLKKLRYFMRNNE